MVFGDFTKWSKHENVPPQENHYLTEIEIMHIKTMGSD